LRDYNYPFLKTKLFTISGEKFTNFSIKQYSNNFDIIGLMAVPRKSSNVMAFEMFDLFCQNHISYTSLIIVIVLNDLRCFGKHL